MLKKQNHLPKVMVKESIKHCSKPIKSQEQNLGAKLLPLGEEIIFPFGGHGLSTSATYFSIDAAELQEMKSP